jgi:CHAD domain-containing protein
LLAGPGAEAQEEDRPLLAAVLGVQSVLDGQLRDHGHLRLGRKRAAGDPAFAMLSPASADQARRLAVALFTARQLGSGPLPVLTVSERRVTLAEPENAPNLPLDELAALWERAAGRELRFAGANGGRRLGLRYDQSLAAAGRTILGAQLKRLQQSAADLEGDDEVEALHDARVATRRMRTLLRLLKKAFPSRASRRHNRALKRAGDLLGAVRDLDVLIGDAQQEHDQRGEIPRLRPLIAAWTEERSHARTSLLKHLESAPFQMWLHEFQGFVEATATGARGEGRLCDELPELIWNRYGVVRAYQQQIQTASLPALHELRKDVKQLRYLLEFFAELLGDEILDLVAGCVQVQDALGVLHDAVARKDRLQIGTLDGKLAGDAAVAAYRLLTLSEITRRRRAFEELWPEITGRGFRRDLAAAAAEV